jgi:hypothetical protein
MPYLTSLVHCTPLCDEFEAFSICPSRGPFSLLTEPHAEFLRTIRSFARALYHQGILVAINSGYLDYGDVMCVQLSSPCRSEQNYF